MAAQADARLRSLLAHMLLQLATLGCRWRQDALPTIEHYYALIFFSLGQDDTRAGRFLIWMIATLAATSSSARYSTPPHLRMCEPLSKFHFAASMLRFSLIDVISA